MAIEITGLPQTTVKEGGGNANAVQQQDQHRQKPTAPMAPSDAVTLTEISVKLQALESSMSSIPVIDQAKVDRIKNAIANGNYNIDSTSTADKLIKLEKSLFS